MAKYIDKTKIAEQIDRARQACSKVACNPKNEECSDYYLGKAQAYQEMQDLLDTLDTIESKEAFPQIYFHDMSQDDSPCICLWKNWSGVIPRIGDTVLLQFGEHKEIEKPFAVIGRTVSEIAPDKVEILLIPQGV